MCTLMKKMLRPTQVFINGLLWGFFLVWFFGLEAGHPVLYSLHIGPINLKFIFYTRGNLSPMRRLVPSFPLVVF